MLKITTLLALGLLLAAPLSAQTVSYGGEVWNHTNADASINVQWIRLNSSDPGGTSLVQWGYSYGGCPVWVQLNANQSHVDSRPYPDLLVHSGSLWAVGTQNQIWNLLKKEYLSDQTVVLRLGYDGWNQDSKDKPKLPIHVSKTSTAPALAEKLVPSMAVIDNGDGTLTATFGYQGNWNNGITYPIYCRRNALKLPGGATLDGAVPLIFTSGSHPDAFAVTFPATEKVRWLIDNKVLVANAAVAVTAPTAAN